MRGLLPGEFHVIERVLHDLGEKAAINLSIDGQAHRLALAFFAIRLTEHQRGVRRHRAFKLGLDDEAGVAFHLGIARRERGFEGSGGGVGRFGLLLRDDGCGIRLLQTQRDLRGEKSDRGNPRSG